ncbi:MAG: oligosaccharide flippase family protein [Bryobacterales bacterium]|nr:oligosaccharide flippase family protein [Bryobacterales bacterium]
MVTLTPTPSIRMLLALGVAARTRLLRVFPADSVRGRLASGTFWSLLAALTTQLSAIGSSVVAGRVLGQAGFGQLGIINSTIGMLGAFTGFALGMTATKYVAEFRVKDPVGAGHIIALSSIVALLASGFISLLLILFAPVLASHILAAPHLVPELRVAALLLLFNAVNGVQIGILSGLEAFQGIARANILRSLLSLPVVVGGLLLGRLLGVVWGLVLAAAIGCLITQYIVSDECRRAAIPIRYAAANSQLRVLWHFSLPAFLSGTFVGPVTWVAHAMLVNRPNGYAEMGVFNAANQWRTAVLFLPGLVGQVSVPLLSAMQAKGETHRGRKILAGSTLTSACCAIPLVLILLPCGSWIMSFYGEGFSKSTAVFQVSLLSAALLAIQTPIGNVITAYGRMWLGLLMNMGWAACFLVTAHILLALGWGANALASAYLTAYALHAMWTFWFAASLLRQGDNNSGSSTAPSDIDEQPF